MTPSPPPLGLRSSKEQANARAAAQLNMEDQRAYLMMSGFTPILNFGLFWAPYFLDVFTPIMNFGHFWALPFFKISVFCPTRFFRQFWADPTFSVVRRTFLAEEESHNLECLPHPKFWPFLGRPLKDVLELFQIFGPAPSPHTVSIVSCVFLCVLLPCSLTIFSVFRCLGVLGVQVFRC